MSISENDPDVLLINYEMLKQELALPLAEQLKSAREKLLKQEQKIESLHVQCDRLEAELVAVERMFFKLIGKIWGTESWLTSVSQEDTSSSHH